jgi:hypothetical protein
LASALRGWRPPLIMGGRLEGLDRLVAQVANNTDAQ